MPDAMAAIASPESSDEERKQGAIASQLVRHSKQLIKVWRLNSHLPYHDYHTFDIVVEKKGRTFLASYSHYTTGRGIKAFCWLALLGIPSK